MSRLQAAWIVGALSCLCLAGCVSKGGWRATSGLVPEELAASRTLSPARIDAAAWPSDQWWRTYQDAQLNELMNEALAGSPSLQSAQARLQAAQARALQTSGARLPSTAASAQVTRQRYSANGLYPPPFAGHFFTDGDLTLNLSYDIDFWGRNLDILQSAQADVRAAEADRAAARLALTGAVARAYFQLDLQFALLDVAQASLEQQNAILSLTQQRVSAGLDNVARVRQAEASAALTRAGVEYTQSQVKVIRAQLGELVGAGPDRGATLERPHLQGPQDVALPSALPAELLGRRPDVLAQRWRVETASRGIAAAEADFYPNVNLAAFAGFQSIGLSKLFNGGSAVVGVGPALSLPIFNRRLLRGALASQQAQYDLSVAGYNQTLLEAVNQVADVVTNWDALAREAEAARLAEEAARKAYDTTRQRYGAGLDNYLSVLSAQNELFLTQTVRAELLTRGLSLTADLVQALGGGYAPQGSAPIPAPLRSPAPTGN